MQRERVHCLAPWAAFTSVEAGEGRQYPRLILSVDRLEPATSQRVPMTHEEQFTPLPSGALLKKVAEQRQSASCVEPMPMVSDARGQRLQADWLEALGAGL